MKQIFHTTYKCDHCGRVFESLSECQQHESECGMGPVKSKKWVSTNEPPAARLEE